jgi:hypothetical protein
LSRWGLLNTSQPTAPSFDDSIFPSDIPDSCSRETLQ